MLLKQFIQVRRVIETVYIVIEIFVALCYSITVSKQFVHPLYAVMGSRIMKAQHLFYYKNL